MVVVANGLPRKYNSGIVSLVCEHIVQESSGFVAGRAFDNAVVQQETAQVCCDGPMGIQSIGWHCLACLRVDSLVEIDKPVKPSYLSIHKILVR